LALARPDQHSACSDANHAFTNAATSVGATEPLPSKSPASFVVVPLLRTGRTGHGKPARLWYAGTRRRSFGTRAGSTHPCTPMARTIWFAGPSPATPTR